MIGIPFRSAKNLLAACAVLCVVGACDGSSNGGGRTDPEPVGSGVTSPNVCAPPTEDAPADPNGVTLVETRPATALGLEAASLNGRIQPRGRPTSYRFEYGSTTAYGSSTPIATVSPKLAAFYRETWNDGLGGWAGGLTGDALKHLPSGGKEGGFVRYALPGEIDAAHADGIGANELVQYMYPSAWEGGVQYAAFGGGDPDMRGAKISTHVRGASFVPKNSEVVFWLQSTPNLAASYAAETARWSNWAFTGKTLTDALFSGAWEKVEYRLHADTTQWTYAGHSPSTGRETYIYVPLDQVLWHLNGDMFHMLMFFEFTEEPEGTMDFDELEVAYANRSVLLPSNGGRLVSSPPGGDDAARLTDGWRNGPERTWRSAASPSQPLELVYELAQPVTLDAVQIHQSPEWPSKDIEVLVSSDGTSYQTLTKDVVPEAARAGPNFAFLLANPLKVKPMLPWVTEKVKHIKVRILSGYKSEYWGLGEIEIFGQGASMETDDAWYSVTADIAGLAKGEPLHYRLVAESAAGLVFGEDKTFTPPATPKPDVISCGASRVHEATAKLEGRLNPMGIETQYYFEYGLDDFYGLQTAERYGGLELTPRTVTETLTKLVPGKTYHYRLVATNRTGASFGADTTFVAK